MLHGGISIDYIICFRWIADKSLRITIEGLNSSLGIKQKNSRLGHNTVSTATSFSLGTRLSRSL